MTFLLPEFPNEALCVLEARPGCCHYQRIPLWMIKHILFSLCFPLIPHILQKLKLEESEMCIVVPFGKPNPSFHFWGLSLWISHSYCHCLILRISCFIPLTGQKNKKVKRVFLDRVQNSSLELEHGDDALKRLITATPRSGLDIVWRGTSLPVLRL